jgi:hypothetical protein
VIGRHEEKSTALPPLDCMMTVNQLKQKKCLFFLSYSRLPDFFWYNLPKREKITKNS